MSSPHSLGIRRGSFLLLQEDPSLLASKGHGTLASLIRRRSTVGPHSWDDEEAGGRLEWAGVGEAEPRRDEERRLSILNTPQMRSMRLIGNANSRYRWQHYWKTEDQLRTMKRPMLFTLACGTLPSNALADLSPQTRILCADEHADPAVSVHRQAAGLFTAARSPQ